MRTSLALAAAGLLLITVPALAATRDERPARDGSTTPVVTPAPVPTPVVLPPVGGTSSHNSGSIQSHSTVSTNSGGNSGGHVTTGDQSATITVVNVGPTSSNTEVIIPAPQPAPAPAPSCTDRTCLRTR